MEARSLLRPLQCLTLASAKPAPSTITRSLVSRRNQSTTSRTKKALKVAAHPSFTQSTGESDHIIFNPPAAAPSVYHTPFKFLPKSDPRRQANLAELLRSSGASSSSASGSSSNNIHTTPLPPLATKVDGETKRYHLTREDVANMRRLRAEDPAKWSVIKLAEKFQCTQYFVMMCCKADKEHRRTEKDRLEAIKARWGPIRREARDQRFKRKQLLLRGEL